MSRLATIIRQGALALATLIAATAWSAAVSAKGYRLGVQDRLRIHVSEWPALNGEVVVGAGGEISLPIIGQIPAAQLDTAELAKAIAERLREKAGLPQLPDTTVDIVAYRPFYILGSVTTPGEYMYRPGMIVLNAVSIAGGIYRAERRSEWDVERVTISSRGELSVLALRRQDLLAERARLDAELDNLDTFPPAPAKADPQFLGALEEQRRIFEASAERRRSERNALESAIAARQKELASIVQQADDVARKRQVTETELAQVRGLAKRDLAVHRLFPLERTLADVLREQQELEIRKLRAEQSLSEGRTAIANLDAQRRAEALAGIQRVNAQLGAVERQQRALARLLDSAASYSSDIAQDQAAAEAPRLRYTILRPGEPNREFEASETTPVQPGDIVKVFKVMEAPVPEGPAASAENGRKAATPEAGRF
jgi:protein involved in polysaccharide export with SLBB domain